MIRIFASVLFLSTLAWGQTGYVSTPFGYFHQSCVKQLSAGDTLHEQAIQHKDGSWGSAYACTFASLAAKTNNGWVESYTYQTEVPVGKLSVKWTVPKAPTTRANQTIYLFPGLEDAEKITTIAQPVLGWNSDLHNAWTISSWNCCVNGTVYESSFVKVNPGDSLVGSVKMDCKANVSSCGTYDVTLEDVTSKKTVTLRTSSFGQQFDLVFGGAVEAYNLTKCSEYPASPVNFTEISIYDDKLKRVILPEFSLSYIQYGPTPLQCGYSGSTNGTTQGQLKY